MAGDVDPLEAFAAAVFRAYNPDPADQLAAAVSAAFAVTPSVMERSEALRRQAEAIAARHPRQGVDAYGHPVSQEFKRAVFANYERLRDQFRQGAVPSPAAPAVFASGMEPSPYVRRLFGLDR